MDNLLTFTNEDFGEIRTVEENGKIYFVGKDVAEILGYSDTNQAIRKHVDADDKLTRNFDGSGQNREMYIINESGLYSLILSSKLPKAKQFKHWVTSEVLPTIRTTGQYIVPALNSNDSLTPMIIGTPDAKDYLQAARLVANCPIERLRVVVSLLKNGGFDMTEADEYVRQIDTGDISQRLSDAMRITGLGVAEIAQKCNIPTEVIRGYYRQRRFPRPDRYISIVNTLDNLLKKYEVTNYEPA